MKSLKYISSVMLVGIIFSGCSQSSQSLNFTANDLTNQRFEAPINNIDSVKKTLDCNDTKYEFEGNKESMFLKEFNKNYVSNTQDKNRVDNENQKKMSTSNDLNKVMTTQYNSMLDNKNQQDNSISKDLNKAMTTQYNSMLDSKKIKDNSYILKQNNKNIKLAAEVTKNNIYTIYFDFNKSAKNENVISYHKKMENEKKLLKSNFLITGNTDIRGTEDYNYNLGLRRASTIEDTLRRLGVAEDKIVVKSNGELKQICQEKDETCYKYNRRVDVTINNN